MKLDYCCTRVHLYSMFGEAENHFHIGYWINFPVPLNENSVCTNHNVEFFKNGHPKCSLVARSHTSILICYKRRKRSSSVQ